MQVLKLKPENMIFVGSFFVAHQVRRQLKLQLKSIRIKPRKLKFSKKRTSRGHPSHLKTKFPGGYLIPCWWYSKNGVKVTPSEIPLYSGSMAALDVRQWWVRNSYNSIALTNFTKILVRIWNANLKLITETYFCWSKIVKIG